MTFAREIRTREIGSVGWIGLLEMNIRAALAAFQRENVLVIKNSLLNVFYFHNFLFLGFFSFVSSHHSPLSFVSVGTRGAGLVARVLRLSNKHGSC